MKKSALNKDIIKEFTKSRSRVLSIIAMVALGALAIIGLTVTGPTMRESVERRLEDYNMPDVIVRSTYGLDFEDRATIDRTDGMKLIEYGYELDLVIDGSDDLIRLESISGTLPKYKVNEGRLPENKGEIAIDADLKNNYKIGDSINFLKGNLEPLEDELNSKAYKIVGIVESPEYFTEIMKGRSFYGKGQLDGFAVALEDEFNLEEHSVARIMLTNTAGLARYNTNYSDITDGFKSKLSANLDDRPEKRLAKIRDEAGTEIADAEKEISDAKIEISDAEKDLKDAREELDDALIKYRDGKEEFERETKKARSELTDAKIKLDDAKSKIETGKKDYEDGLKKFNDEITKAEAELKDAESELAEAKKELDDGYKEYNTGLEKYNKEISDAEKELADAKLKLDDARTELDDGWKEYNEGIETYDREIANAENEIRTGEIELENAKKSIEDGKLRIASEEDNLRRGWQQYNSGLAELEAQRPALEQAKAQLDGAQAQIDAGYDEINGQENSLNTQKNQLLGQKAQLEGGIAEQDAVINNPESSDEDKAYAEFIKAQLQEQLAGVEVLLAQVEGGLAHLANERANLDLQQQALNEEYEKFNVGYHQFLSAEQELRSAKAKLEQGEVEIANAKAQIKSGEAEYNSGVQKLADAKNTLESERINGKKDLEDAHVKLNDGEAEYTSGLADYESGLNEYNTEKAKGEAELADAKKKLDDGQAKYDDGLKEYQDGLNTFNEEKSKGEAELADAKQKLIDGEAEYNSGLKEYEDGLKEYNTEYAKGNAELEDAYKKILDGEEEYKDGYNEFLEKTEDANKKIADGESEISDAKTQLSKLKLPTYFVSDINDNNGIHTFLEQSRKNDMLALIFPVFLYAIAMLVTTTTMSRMIDEQRTQIGTLKALGYSTGSITKKYLIYGAVPATIGAIIGIILGHTVLSKLIYDAYALGYFVGPQVMRPFPGFIILTLILSVVLITLTALVTINRTLKHNAAELLRPKAPKIGMRILLERVKPIWNRMSFLYKVTARNIFRYKARMAMTIIGVAGCTALIFMGFGIKDSIGLVKPLQFGEIINYNVAPIINLDADQSDIDDYREYIKNNRDIKKSTDVRYESGQIELKGQPDMEVNIITVFDDIAFKEFVSLRDRSTKEAISVKNSGVVISEKLSSLLNLKVGDKFIVEDSDNIVNELVVGAITENYVVHYIYLSPDAYQTAFGKRAEINSNLLIVNKEGNAIDNLISELMTKKGVLSIVDQGRSDYQIGELLRSMGLIVLVLIAISSTLAVVVLYNLTNINVSERIRELSTIKVLGFYANEVTSYVYRETYILTAIGILLGFVGGHILHYFVSRVLVIESMMFPPRILLSNYLLSAAITIILSVIVMLLMHRKLKRVDMVEALKAIE